ncbi:MAG: hypothetical protein CL424_20135 [Acidimicrobiaceae bacterium]|nr:hypothetical protein [Acidimicrobiaceae bacterium]
MSTLPSTVTDPTVPTSAPPSTPVSTPIDSPIDSDQGLLGSIGDVVRGTIDNLGENGYQTGVAIVVTTIAVVAMLNIKAPRWIIAPVGVGAFWAGWLSWNTMTGQDNPLFPGDIDATKLWDVALAGDSGFLIVVIVACVAALFIWRTSMALASRLMLMLGAVLGASFIFNLFEAVRVA